ncbi:MAG: hypothetical protein EPO28_09920 [Saprospiraceae bacterium]|nr:MAG: hypothetical protein EPO28_09920 [Saprospiraceae bacterium]
MKNGFLLLFFAFLSYSLTGQSIFTIGANYSTLSYWHAFPFGKQKLENFKLTPSIGYGYLFKVNDRWSYQPGISLGDLGRVNYRNHDKPNEVVAIYAVYLNQFIDYKPVAWLSIGISPSVNYNLYAGITGKVLHSSSTGGISFSNNKLINWKDASPSYKLNRFVFSIVPRVTFHLKERWSMDLFYRNDLTSVGYPSKILNFDLRGYGVGANLKYQLKPKKTS